MTYEHFNDAIGRAARHDVAFKPICSKLNGTMTHSSPIYAESFITIVIADCLKSSSQTNKCTSSKQYMAEVPRPRDAELVYTMYEKL